MKPHPLVDYYEDTCFRHHWAATPFELFTFGKARTPNTCKEESGKEGPTSSYFKSIEPIVDYNLLDTIHWNNETSRYESY